MFRYFKSLSILMILLTISAAGLLSFISSVVFENNEIARILCIIVGLLFFVVAGNSFIRIVQKKVIRETKIMTEQCDPGKYLLKSDSWRIKEIRNSLEALVESYRILAFISEGRDEEAREVFEVLASGTQGKIDPLSKAYVAIYAYEPARDLFGEIQAGEYINEAYYWIEKAEETDKKKKSMKAIDECQTIHKALIAKDPLVFLQTIEPLLNNAGWNTFMRVRYSFLRAEAYRKIGDLAQEQNAIEFVVAYGNELNIARSAKARLAQLKQSGENGV